MPNDDNKIILEFPATNVEIELGETITFDNISGFLNSDRVTYDGESLTDEITHLENDKADSTYVDTELAKKADKTDTYTKTQVDDIVYDILPDETASGSVANFETDLALPLKSLEVDVDAVQESGTPTPETPLPISGWSEISLCQRGANLFDKTTIINNCYINNTNGTQRYNAGDKCTDFIEIAPNTTYFIYTEQTIGRWGAWYDENKNFISGINIYGVRTTPANAKYARFTVVRQDNGNPDTFSVNYPSTDTAYHAYNGNTEIINLGGIYYGGHFTQDKDGHRQFEATHGIIDLGEPNWRYSVNDSWFQIAHAHKYPTSNTLCSCYPVVYSLVNLADKTIAVVTGYLAIKDTSFGSDVNAFKTAMTGQKLVYELTTPYTIDLPDGEPIITFNGVNNIYADSGDTAVEFKESINQKIASLQALILST